MAEKPRAVVLLSGGMDSCVTAAIAHETHRLALVHASYGQRTERRERQAFEEIADFYCVRERLVVRLEHFAQIGGSALTDPRIPVPERGPQAAPGQSGTIPPTYVPFRNAHFLSVAVSWAEVIGATAVFIGAVAEDSSGYPDCRPEYYRVFANLVRAGTPPAAPATVAACGCGHSQRPARPTLSHIGRPIGQKLRDNAPAGARVEEEGIVMKRAWRGWIVLSVALVLGPVAAWLGAGAAAQGMGRIYGQVLDREGKPFPDVTVVIQSDMGQTWEVKTDKNGRYSQSGLKGANTIYTIKFKVKDQVIWEEKRRLESAGEEKVDLNIKEKIAKQGAVNVEEEKKREEESKKFEGMKAHFEAGRAALDQAKLIRNEMMRLP